MIVVESAPAASRLPVNKTGGEGFGIPIALLNNAHLGAVGGDGATDDARFADVSEAGNQPYDERRRNNAPDYAWSNSHVPYNVEP
jgi:hypothetical protein